MKSRSKNISKNINKLSLKEINNLIEAYMKNIASYEKKEGFKKEIILLKNKINILTIRLQSLKRQASYEKDLFNSVSKNKKKERKFRKEKEDLSAITIDEWLDMFKPKEKHPKREIDEIIYRTPINNISDSEISESDIQKALLELEKIEKSEVKTTSPNPSFKYFPNHLLAPA